MLVPSEEKIRWFLVKFSGDEPGARLLPVPDNEPDTLAPEETAPPAPDPNAIQLLVSPPNNAEVKVIVLKNDLSDAKQLLGTAIHQGFLIHGTGYFDSIERAINSPLANAYQGSQQPQRQLTGEQIAQLQEIVRQASGDERKRINAAVTAVEAAAALYAMGRLDNSINEVVSSTVRYILETSTDDKAKAWLQKADDSPGARIFRFNNDAILDLVKGLCTLRAYYLAVAKKDAKLASVMKDSASQMQQIAGNRWQFLRRKDPKNTPPAGDSVWSDGYGVKLLDASNAKRPDLVAEAQKKYPDPANVSTARADMLEAAAALTATLVDEGSVHPVLYRIWSPSLAEILCKEFNRPHIGVTSTQFPPIFEFRLAISQALRSTYAAANSLRDSLSRDGSYVWAFPALVRKAIDSLNLPEDDYQRIVAEHRLEELAESIEKTLQGFARASEVFMATELAIRFLPAPEITIPVTAVITALDTVVGGLSLLYQFFAQSDMRDGFRAFLVPGESFAASDGSYLGIIVGAAFLLFGTAGLRRTTISAPTKTETAIVAGTIVGQEYSTLRPAKREP